MTTLVHRYVFCHICGTGNRCAGIASTNRMGSSDLDTRPPEMERSTIAYMVQRCHACGYCAPDISKGTKEFADIVESPEYKAMVENDSIPKLLSRFICWATLQDSTGNHVKAGWAWLHAAWVCDDAKDNQAAVEYRSAALRHFESARDAGEGFADDEGVEDAILADLLRRSGQFDAAVTHCRSSRLKPKEALIDTILRFQEKLAQGQDDKCYTVADVNHFDEEKRD